MDIILKQMELSGISTDDILDFMFNEIDDLQIERKFEDVDNIISDINIENMTDVTILGILTITYPYRKMYKNRNKFYYDSEKIMKSRLSSEEVDNLLHGFIS